MTTSELWSRLEPGLRDEAARCLYEHDWADAGTRREADLAIAQALRFREVAVRKLPLGKRAEYLARVVRPTDSLASSLLLALHLERRRPMLAAFLDALGIPHEDGLIRTDHDLRPPASEAAARAAAALFATFPEAEVEVYLRTLVAMDPETWTCLDGLVEERRGARPA